MVLTLNLLVFHGLQCVETCVHSVGISNDETNKSIIVTGYKCRFRVVILGDLAQSIDSVIAPALWVLTLPWLSKDLGLLTFGRCSSLF